MVKDLCFEVIEKCLNSCKFCSSDSNCNKNKIIEFDDFKRIIDYFIEKGGLYELSLSGGEPFLHPDIIKMVKYAKSFGIRTVIFTSGVVYGKKLNSNLREQLLNEMNDRLKKIDVYEKQNEYLKIKVKKYYMDLIEGKNYQSIDRNILHELKEIGLDKIVFDVQAYQYETDYSVMGRNEQARVSSLKSLIDGKFEKIDIDVHFVPMKPNYKEIIDILELLEIAGVENISILNFLPQGRGKINVNDLLLTENEKKDFFNILKNSENIFSGNIRIGIPLSENDGHKCNAGLEKLDIKFDGSVLPCPAFKEITKEECERFNINIPNIYTNLEGIVIIGSGTRAKPLCKQIYKSKKYTI